MNVVAPLAPVPASVGEVGAVVRRVLLPEMTCLDSGRERDLAEAIDQNRPPLLGDRVALRLFIYGALLVLLMHFRPQGIAGEYRMQ